MKTISRSIDAMDLMWGTLIKHAEDVATKSTTPGLQDTQSREGSHCCLKCISTCFQDVCMEKTQINLELNARRVNSNWGGRRGETRFPKIKSKCSGIYSQMLHFLAGKANNNYSISNILQSSSSKILPLPLPWCWISVWILNDISLWLSSNLMHRMEFCMSQSMLAWRGIFSGPNTNQNQRMKTLYHT